MNLSDLQNKDIINMIDGKKIGNIIDVRFNPANGYWLENPQEKFSPYTSTYVAYSVYFSNRNFGGTNVDSSSSFGVRPVIEVLKTSIEN